MSPGLCQRRLPRQPRRDGERSQLGTMAQEIVITSVRRGLDGGSGYQPVLRTQGMKPAVAERLQIRSGYSHPYPFGDPRNPVVFIHRIERVAGQTLNVLGRICDVGSDHTGRSNFLAHLAALDDTEARRKTAGPADVARRFAFKTTWNEQPREADPPPVIGADRGPAACVAWRAAGLDPGLAGDLAEAAASGKETRLIVRQGDDVLALFADAIALLPPAKRWQVTFNTCEIEPFDAVWRAVREDLPQARSWRGSTGVIDLTSSATKGSDSIYARFARGEASALPWQTPVSDSAKPSTAVATSTPQSPPTEESSHRGTVVHHASETQVPPVAPPSPGDSVPPPPDGPSPPVGPKKRNYLEHVERAALDRDQLDRAAPTRSTVLRFAGLAAVVTLLLTLIGVLAANSLSPELGARLASILRGTEDSEVKQVALAEPDGTGDESTSLGEAGQAERKRRADETARNKKRADEDARVALEEEQKRKAADDERKALERKRTEAETQAQRDAARKQRDAKQAAAFAAFEKLDGIPEQDLPAAKMGDGALVPSTICSLDADNLVDLSLDLAAPAVPRDPPDNGESFRVNIEPVADKTPTWEVSALGQGLDKTPLPIPLATIVAKDGRLLLQPANMKILENQRFSHLRRSVLLVRARNPEKPNEGSGIVKAIQLVRPVVIPPLEVSLLDPSTPIKLQPPPGFSPPELFPGEVQVDYEIAYGFGLDRSPKKEVHRGKWRTGDTPVFVPLLQCPPAPPRPQNPPTFVGLRLAFANGLSELRITPQIQGLAEKSFSLEEISRYVRKSDADFREELNRIQNDTLKLINPFLVPVDRIDANKLKSFVKTHERELEDYFQPQPCAAWRNECTQILLSAASLPQPGMQKGGTGGVAMTAVTQDEFEQRIKPLRSDWQRTFVAPLEEWAKHRAKQQHDQLSERRQCFAPLKEPAYVLLRTITTQAVDRDKTKHSVTLLTGSAEHKPRNNTSPPPENKPSVN